MVRERLVGRVPFKGGVFSHGERLICQRLAKGHIAIGCIRVSITRMTSLTIHRCAANNGVPFGALSDIPSNCTVLPLALRITGDPIRKAGRACPLVGGLGLKRLEIGFDEGLANHWFRIRRCRGTMNRGCFGMRSCGEGGGSYRGEVNNGVDGVPDFSTIIAQQLQNLLPTIVAQVGDQGRGQGNSRNQYGDAINDNIRGDVRNVIENNDRMGCTYKELLACNPKEYDWKGGAVVYTCWIEKMKSVQDMSGCGDNQKVKYTGGSFVGKALTWWNSQIRTLGREVAKMELELWNHAMVGVGHAAYTDRFHELARLVPHLVTLENRRIERYVYGLAPQI
ncbi:hypothetical protein Tco_1508788 [Tanacetum coccineum]